MNSACTATVTLREPKVCPLHALPRLGSGRRGDQLAGDSFAQRTSFKNRFSRQAAETNRLAACAPQKRACANRDLQLFRSDPRQRVEIDVAAGQDDADAATAKIDLVLDDCGIRNGG
jgi:hypothetical protein